MRRDRIVAQHRMVLLQQIADAEQRQRAEASAAAPARRSNSSVIGSRRSRPSSSAVTTAQIVSAMKRGEKGSSNVSMEIPASRTAETPAPLSLSAQSAGSAYRTAGAARTGRVRIACRMRRDNAAACRPGSRLGDPLGCGHKSSGAAPRDGPEHLHAHLAGLSNRQAELPPRSGDLCGICLRRIRPDVSRISTAAPGCCSASPRRRDESDLRRRALLVLSAEQRHRVDAGDRQISRQSRCCERAGVPTLGGRYFFLHDRHRAHAPARTRARATRWRYLRELGGRGFRQAADRLARRFRAGDR